MNLPDLTEGMVEMEHMLFFEVEHNFKVEGCSKFNYPIFLATQSISSLGHLKSKIVAQNGKNGGSDNCTGKNAEPHIIPVPVGTVFRNMEREIICELVEEGASFIAAKGGAGGKGNTFFKSSVRQTPRVCEMGGVGETFVFDIGKRILKNMWA